MIDDDPEVLGFLSAALTELGHDVHCCDGAEDGLKRLEQHSPDLILIDFAMPGMNGAQLAQAIRERHGEQRIVFVTGYAETEQLEAALGAGAPVLRKPFSIADLSAAIAAHAS